MPSRLSSILVRDGLVGVKRMERAFQRQVIYGGALDTILLEMSMVPEERLVQYLSLASGLPPAAREETEVFDPRAIKTCAEAMARDFGVVPLCFDDGALRVLVRDPVDLGRLEELANELDTPVQPLVVPEYRFHVVFDRAFGRETDARFAALAKKSAEATPTPPVGKPRTVIVEASNDEGAEDHVVVNVTLPPSKTTAPRTKTMSLSSDALQQHLAQTEQQRRDADARRKPTADIEAVPQARDAEETQPMRARGDGADEATPDGEPDEIEWSERETQPMERLRDAAAEAVARASAEEDAEPAAEATEPAAEPNAKIDAMIDAAVPAQPIFSPDTPLPAPVREPPPPRSVLSIEDTAPLSATEAREALAQADDRDLIFSILLRAVRGRTWYAGLLTIQGRAAIGRIAIAGDRIDREGTASVLVPIDDARAFAQAVSSAAPYIGPIATGDSEIDAMLARLGGVVPPSALLLPITLKNRVVALVVGHRGADQVGAADLAELLPLATSAADALSRLITKRKGVGYKSGADASAPVPKVDLDELPTTRVDKSDAGWAAPTADAPTPELDFGSEVSMEAGEPEPIEQLLDLIEQSEEGAAEDVFREAVHRADESLELIRERFPGTLRVDRYELSGRILRPREHGGLLALVVELGAAAADLLIALMKDPNRDTRYYATLCTSEIRPRSALVPLVERLFDADYGIRAVAIDGLRSYAFREVDSALEYARHALHSEDAKRVQAAADAAAALDDVAAIPDLLDANQRGDDGAPYARRALVALTKQTFGSSNRKWRSWWDKHRKQHRLEWLIEGLTHKEEGIRESSAEELRKITGEYFGYHHDLPRKEREQARQRWVQWWHETGRRRFLRDDPAERHRPTAVLPARRE